MSKKVFARNQSFVFHTINTSQNPKSAVCTITINNSATPEYTLIDNNLEIVSSVAYAKFEISSLVRDFIEIDPPTYVSGSMYSPNFTNTAIEVDTSIRFYDANNGLGTALGSAKNDTAFYLDGYTTKFDNSNAQFSDTVLAQTNRLLQLPEGVPANVPRFSTNGLQYETINTLASGWQTLTNGFRVYVERLCYNATNQSGQTRNELDYRQIVFINKDGAYQSLWFLKMMNKSQSATGETYLSNPTDRLGRVNRNNHYYNDYNKTSRQGFSLLSPLVPEGFYDVFQELLLSEYVWIWEWNYEWDITGSGDIRYVDPYTGILEKRTLPVKTIVSYRKPQATNGVIVRPLYNLTPVNIKTSGLTKKTHSQDKTNIQYQFDFDYAFDDVYLHS